MGRADIREASPRREGRSKVGGLTPGPGKGMRESILGGGTTTCKVHAGREERRGIEETDRRAQRVMSQRSKGEPGGR